MEEVFVYAFEKSRESSIEGRISESCSEAEETLVSASYASFIVVKFGCGRSISGDGDMVEVSSL
jgi:hypothetical protein